MKRLAFALVALGMGGLAHADSLGWSGGPPPDFGEKPYEEHHSPQRWAIEIKFTPYTPHIDNSAGLGHTCPNTTGGSRCTPFSDLFQPRKVVNGVDLNQGKQPPYRLLTSVEFDYQFLHKAYGTFGVGLTTGFYRRTTHSFEYNVDKATGAISPCVLVDIQDPSKQCVRSGDQTGLNILPLSALFVYRLETLSNRWHIPLVPYVKVGLAYYIWWINDGSGILSSATYPRPSAANLKPASQSSGYGGSFGFVLNPGIALQLDWIDRSAAITMDHELGINHTYLFCELSYANVNGFGASNKLDLSDTMLNAGIGFDF